MPVKPKYPVRTRGVSTTIIRTCTLNTCVLLESPRDPATVAFHEQRGKQWEVGYRKQTDTSATTPGRKKRDRVQNRKVFVCVSGDEHNYSDKWADIPAYCWDGRKMKSPSFDWAGCPCVARTYSVKKVG